MTRLLLSLLNGLALGGILFLVSAGLTFTFGVLRVLNLAHGALYMIGAFVGWAVAVQWGWGYLAAVAAGAVAAAVIGIVIHRGFLRYVHGGINEQAVLTFGFVLILTNLTQWMVGPQPKVPFTPPALAGTVSLGTTSFPLARLTLIVVALVIAAALMLIDRGTLIGARIRAARTDPVMLRHLGVNVGLLTTGVFAAGAALAGLGGVIGAQVLGANIDQAVSVLLLAIVVVVVGGLGSVLGSLIGAVLIGCLQALGTVYFPALASFTIYLVMIAILLVRPTGLLRGSAV